MKSVLCVCVNVYVFYTVLFSVVSVPVERRVQRGIRGQVCFSPDSLACRKSFLGSSVSLKATFHIYPSNFLVGFYEQSILSIDDLYNIPFCSLQVLSHSKAHSSAKMELNQL